MNRLAQAGICFTAVTVSSAAQAVNRRFFMMISTRGYSKCPVSLFPALQEPQADRRGHQNRILFLREYALCRQSAARISSYHADVILCRPEFRVDFFPGAGWATPGGRQGNYDPGPADPLSSCHVYTAVTVTPEYSRVDRCGISGAASGGYS